MILKTRYVLLSFSFFACLLCSCSKSNSRLLFNMTTVYDSVSNTGNIVNVSAQKTGGNDDIINLSVEGLPSYITADISQPVGQLPWTVSINFHFNNAFAESNVSLWTYYTITIKGTTSAGTVRKSTITFFCSPANPTTAFDGHLFWGNESCAVSGSNLRSVNALARGGDTVLLVGFFQTSIGLIDVPAIVNSRGHSIIIPPFTQDYYTFRGSGTFFTTGSDSLAFTISFSRKTASTFDTCSSTFTLSP